MAGRNLLVGIRVHTVLTLNQFHEIRRVGTMNILICGATGGTGRALVEQALAQGHIVTAFARNPSKVRTRHPNLRVVQGDILSPASVEAAISSQEAVLSALGIRVMVWPLLAIVILCQVISRLAGLSWPAGLFVRLGIPLLAFLFLFLLRRTTTLSDGTRNILQTMEKLGVKRFVCESSLGIGDSKGQLGPLYNYVVIPLLLRNIFADKEVQKKLIQKSALDWVIARPARLTNGPRTGKYRSGFEAVDKSIRTKISRADVAEFMLRQLSSDDYLRKTPGISY
jgi:putative NADH-flavin reductase